MSSPVELHAAELGAFARRVLARPATVIARFARSAYVENAAGIACIGGAGLGSGPLNAIVPDLARIPAVGDAVAVAIRGARVWRPAAHARIDGARLAVLLRRLPPVRGRGLYPGRGRHRELREWIARGARGPAPPAAAQLIGRGPGLTPAGDDLIGGALVALRVARRHARASRLGAWALRQARRGTSRISREHLACAAQGHGGAALHGLIDALLAGRRGLAAAFVAIDAVGHTSGWDAAAGALLALEALTPSRTPRARSRAPAIRRATRAGVRPA